VTARPRWWRPPPDSGEPSELRLVPKKSLSARVDIVIVVFVFVFVFAFVFVFVFDNFWWVSLVVRGGPLNHDGGRVKLVIHDGRRVVEWSVKLTAVAAAGSTAVAADADEAMPPADVGAGAASAAAASAAAAGG